MEYRINLFVVRRHVYYLLCNFIRHGMLSFCYVGRSSIEVI